MNDLSKRIPGVRSRTVGIFGMDRLVDANAKPTRNPYNQANTANACFAA